LEYLCPAVDRHDETALGLAQTTSYLGDDRALAGPLLADENDVARISYRAVQRLHCELDLVAPRL
jgi:hypothetical protein